MESREELDELKKKLEQKRKMIAIERSALDDEKDRYVKMVLDREESISRKIKELKELKKSFERSSKEEKIIAQLIDILMSALKKDTKLIKRLMKDLDMTMEDIKELRNISFRER